VRWPRPDIPTAAAVFLCSNGRSCLRPFPRNVEASPSAKESRTLWQNFDAVSNLITCLRNLRPLYRQVRQNWSVGYRQTKRLSVHAAAVAKGNSAFIVIVLSSEMLERAVFLAIGEIHRRRTGEVWRQRGYAGCGLPDADKSFGVGIRKRAE